MNLPPSDESLSRGGLTWVQGPGLALELTAQDGRPVDVFRDGPEGSLWIAPASATVKDQDSASSRPRRTLHDNGFADSLRVSSLRRCTITPSPLPATR